MVQWLRLLAPNAEGMGLIPGQGSKTHVASKTQHNQKQKNEWINKWILCTSFHIMFLVITVVET